MSRIVVSGHFYMVVYFDGNFFFKKKKLAFLCWSAQI